MKSLRSRKLRHREVAELNITAFMNLMVILVPFLLITAVFSRVAVLELDLPAADAPVEIEPEEPALALEVTVRDALIEVGDRNGGLLDRFENLEAGYDLAALSGFLRRVKQQFPEESGATLLLEADIAYETIVAVMDTMRVAELVDADSREFVRYDLFPEISIGDAPLLALAEGGR
jgi:biopolymer transport protein ExbD